MATSKENVDNYKFTNLEPQVITARAQLQQLLSREDLRLERNSEENSTLTLDSLAEEFDEALSSLSMDTNSAVRLLSEARAVAEDRLGLGSPNLANMEETFAELPLAKVSLVYTEGTKRLTALGTFFSCSFCATVGGKQG